MSYSDNDKLLVTAQGPCFLIVTMVNCWSAQGQGCLIETMINCWVCSRSMLSSSGNG